MFNELRHSRSNSRVEYRVEAVLLKPKINDTDILHASTTIPLIAYSTSLAGSFIALRLLDLPDLSYHAEF